jgi:hypothetical protein
MDDYVQEAANDGAKHANGDVKERLWDNVEVGLNRSQEKIHAAGIVYYFIGLERLISSQTRSTK